MALGVFRIINTLRAEQTGLQVADDILKCIAFDEKIEFRLKYLFKIDSEVRFRIRQNRFKQWLDTEEAKSQY